MGPITAIPQGAAGQEIGTQAPPIRYVLYSRKSTADEDRQALSIESQVKEMLAIAERDRLHVVDIKREAHSSKTAAYLASPVKFILSLDVPLEQRNSGCVLRYHDLKEGKQMSVYNSGKLGISSPDETLEMTYTYSLACGDKLLPWPLNFRQIFYFHFISRCW